MSMENHTILLIGGSSGTGKSYLARQLAEHYKTPLTEVDDIRIALQQIVDKAQHPDLYTFVDNPNFYEKYNEHQFVENLLRVGSVVWKSLSVLIEKHIACDEPVIFEGDSIIPNLLAEKSALIESKNIKAIFIYDDANGIRERQIKRNRDEKDFERSEQNALFSATYSQELKRQAEEQGFLTIPASPIETLFSRTLQALGE